MVGDEADAGAVAVDDRRLGGYALRGDLEVAADVGGAVGDDRLLQVRRDLDVLALAQRFVDDALVGARVGGVVLDVVHQRSAEAEGDGALYDER